MKNFFLGIIFILLGVLLLLDNLEVLDFFETIGTYWPLLLIFVGIYYILYSKNKELEKHKNIQNDLIHHSSLYRDIDLKFESKNFKGGSVSTFIGNINLDISNIEFSGGEKILRVNSFIGDIFLKIPDKYNLSFNCSTALGDLKVLDKSSNGLFRNLKFEVVKSESTSQKIHIITSQFIGDLKIN